MFNQILLIIIGWTLGTLCACHVAYWLTALWYVILAHRSIPPITTGLSEPAPPTGWPSVSVIIPAHNEEVFIDRFLTALRKCDYPDLEIIVAADRCTDRTVSVVSNHAAHDPRIGCVEVDECPQGWSGKCHASWKGAQRATGSFLLFTDADTTFDPQLIRASISLCIRERFDFLSLLGSLTSSHGFEQTAQPVAAMMLMSMYPIHRANRNDGKLRRAFANGQFMLFKRSVYDAIGTHEFIKDAILEDLRFARRLGRDDEYRMGLTTAGELFHVRMYESWGEFENGWKRIFTEAANRYPRRLFRAGIRLRLLALGTLVPFVTGLFGAAQLGSDRLMAMVLLFGSLPAIMVQAVALTQIYRLQGASPIHIWRFPLGCWKVARILRSAARDLIAHRGIEWANLRYEVQSTSEHD